MQHTANNTEIEVRFLDIDKDALIKTLHSLKAIDHGETLLEEMIFDFRYNEKGLTGEFIRLRKSNNTVFLTYKNHIAHAIQGTQEIEFEVSSWDKALAFLDVTCTGKKRHQQKKRHTFTLHSTTIDIDTWPRVPTYVEIEGPTEEAVKDMAVLLGFDWNKAVFENARVVIEKYYGISLEDVTEFTFDEQR